MVGAIVSLEHPEEISHGDYSSNVALAYAKKFNIPPQEFAKKIVDKLNQEIVRINEYKRRQSPVGIRVTHRSFGKDWRYPMTNRFRA